MLMEESGADLSLLAVNAGEVSWSIGNTYEFLASMISSGSQVPRSTVQ
jgi:hypothetical protein